MRRGYFNWRKVFSGPLKTQLKIDNSHSGYGIGIYFLKLFLLTLY
jgi:hypothetical protein